MTSEQPGKRLWVNGSVYSPADPFASAILVDGTTVAWVGSDDAARGIAGPDVVPGDLRAAVVTPAFVAHHVLAGPADDAARRLPRAADGYGAVEVLGSDPAALEEAVRRIREDGMHALPVLVRKDAPSGELDVAALPSPALGLDVTASTPADAIREHLVACTRAGILAVLVLTTADTGGDRTPGPSHDLVQRVLASAEAARDEAGERVFRARAHRLVGVGALDDSQCERLVGLSLTVSCRAGEAPLRDLARVGVPVTLMTDDPNPWNAVKAALDAPDERLRTSARAAFMALTRGAWRVHPGSSPLAGQLVPGAEATLAVWDAESVMVQQAQGTGASWSTDPRARTPVLPSLDDSRLPGCEATMVAGAPVSGEEPRP
ncbi:hypothetical protein [Kocuria varians]|uniref:hypothetical protein n=1 Tax=Kocuria varians TaxID=1272 RepID=UPI0008384985|nr:hypothetical protein [Kocuria varians]